MIEFLQKLEAADKDITLALNSLSSPFTDGVWQFFSNKYLWIPLYIVVAAALFRKLGWKRALVSIVAIALTIAACDQLGNLCKEFFARYRPCWTPDVVARGLHILEYKGGYYGFYSAHAANSMGFALGSILAFRWGNERKCTLYAVLITLWAVLVGLGRIMVGKHFLGDVLTGFAVGAAVSSILTCLAIFIYDRIVQKK